MALASSHTLKLANLEDVRPQFVDDHFVTVSLDAKGVPGGAAEGWVIRRVDFAGFGALVPAEPGEALGEVDGFAGRLGAQHNPTFGVARPVKNVGEVKYGVHVSFGPFGFDSLL